MSAKYDGISVTMGGREFTVAPLTLGQLKRLAPRIANMRLGVASTADDIDAFLEVALAALQRNHPEVTREALEEIVDLGNAGNLMRAIMGASALMPAGEAPAGSA